MIFRSEEMNYFDVKLPIDASWEFIESLGSLKLFHFLDSNMHLSFA